MYAHCKNLFLLLLVLMMSSALSLSAASLRWIHLGSHDAGLANLAIGGKIAIRNMQTERVTPWSKVSPGVHRFQIGSEKTPGAPFELEIIEGQKITIVSISDKNGDLQSRTFGVDNPEGELFILNAIPGIMMSLPDNKKAIFGKGFWLPDEEAKTTVSLVDSEGFKGEVDFSRLGDTLKGPYMAIVYSGDANKPKLVILRDRDVFFETSDEPIKIPDQLLSGISIISEGRVIAAGSFDPTAVNWDEVDSQAFWLNLMIGRDPCRLEIKGFPAIRRMSSGRGSGFLKWPAGDWDIKIVVELTNETVASDTFSLARKARAGLISSGGGKYPHRLLTLAGRSPEESGTPAMSQIRFVNALPGGILRSIVQYPAQPVTVTLKPGEIGETLPLVGGGFPGTTFDFTQGAEAPKVIGKIPVMRSLPKGDWVVIIHLDQETFEKPVLTWVEMDKGAITFPTTPKVDE